MIPENTDVLQEEVGVTTRQEQPLTLSEKCAAGDSAACAQLEPTAVKPQEIEPVVEVSEEPVVTQEEDTLSDEDIAALTPVTQEEDTLSDEEIASLTVVDEPSVSRKMEYGASDEPMIGGSIFRAVETGFEALTEGKSWEQSRKDVEAERKAELDLEYPEFMSGKYDGDGAVLAGRVATAVVDPVTFLIPWTKAAKVGQIAKAAVVGDKTSKTAKVAGAVASKAPLFVLGAGTSAADYSLYSYMREGEVDTTGLFFVSAVGGSLTVAVEPFAKFLISKYQGKYGKGANAAKLQKATSADEVQELLGTKTYNALTDKQRTTIDKVFDLPHLRDLNGMLSRSTNMTDVLSAKNAARKEVTKNLRNKKITAVEAAKTRTKIEQSYSSEINKLVDSRGLAIQEIVEGLHKNKALTAVAFEHATRPIMGSLLGGGSGLLMGGDDDTVQMMMAVGLVTGAAQRYIQNHSLIPATTKKELSFGMLKRQWALAAQATKYHTATTQVTKLKALGEQTAKFADLMHHTFSPKGVRQMAVEERAHSSAQFWSIILERDVLKGATREQQQAAVRHLRGFGSKKEQTADIIELSGKINTYLKSFKKYHEDVGIKAKDKLDNYFPREYNFEAVDNIVTKLALPISHPAYKAFNGKDVNEVVAQILKRRDKSTIAAARIKAKNFITSIKSGDVDTITRSVKANDFKLRKLPFVKHMEKHRELHGTIKVGNKTVQIEELINPWLNQDVRSVLGNMSKESSKAVEFTRTFGNRGEVYRTIIKDINKKYEQLLSTASPKEAIKLERLRAKEHKRINGSIDAFFGRYGTKFDRDLNSKGALVSLYNSMLMLEDVSVANLGDLVQPFQNSQGIRQTVKAWRETSWGSKGTAERSEIESSSMIGLIESDAIALEARASAGMQDIGAGTRKASDTFYKFTGLHHVTSFARRFAFNAGSRDLHTVSKKYQKMTTKMINQIERREGRKWNVIPEKKRADLLFNHPNASNRQRLLERGQYFGVDEGELMAVAKYSKYEEAYQDVVLRDLFQMAGFRAMERDAKIPTVGNRLLFTQSRNPAARLLGQFTSWAQAKTAQTNSLIKRIEDADGKLAAKMMGALVIYTGIRHIRDIIREGTLQPEEHTMPEVIARANDLSGNPGIWLGYMTSISKDLSSESRRDLNPLTMFPAGSTATEFGKAASRITKDGFEWEHLDRLIPFPKLRNLLDTFTDEGYIPFKEPKLMKYPEIKQPVIKLARGGLVSAQTQNEMSTLGFARGGFKSKDYNWSSTPAYSGYQPSEQDYTDYLDGTTGKKTTAVGAAASAIGVPGVATALDLSVDYDLGYNISPNSTSKAPGSDLNEGYTNPVTGNYVGAYSENYAGPGAAAAKEAGLTPGSEQYQDFVNQEGYDVPTEQERANKGMLDKTKDFAGFGRVKNYDPDMDMSEKGSQDKRGKRVSRRAKREQAEAATRTREVEAARAEERRTQEYKAAEERMAKEREAADQRMRDSDYDSNDDMGSDNFDGPGGTDSTGATSDDYNTHDNPDESSGPSGGGSSGGGGGGGGSYIATAATQALGKEGLTVFEDWRDYMFDVLPTFTATFGRYRATAPKIVKAIDKKDNSKAIYKEIWDEHLAPIYAMITKDKDSKQAQKDYKVMVKKLKDTYL